MTRKKGGKPPGTQPVLNTSNEDSLTTSMARLKIAQQTPSNTPGDSHGTPVEIVRLTRHNIVTEFDAYFGDESKLENWQRLCRDVGAEGEFSSVTQCKNALKKVWVNIYDLLEARRTGELPCRHFGSRRALIKYTLKHDKVYPKKEAKAEGAVKALLRRIL